jgi:predicted alpha/beta-fold hydrolase
MITDSSFRPAWWCRNRHLQTLYPSLLRRRVMPPLQRQRLELPDGDFLDIDWTALPGTRRVLVLHGLEGSLESHYSGGLLKYLAQRGYRVGLLYFRGCSGVPNRLARSYHSGETGDLDFVMCRLHEMQPGVPLAVIGFSLGGNVLLKWLGEQGSDAPLSTAIAISVPFDLDSAARQLQRGLSRIYRNHLLARLRQSVVAKSESHPPPVPLHRLRTLRSFHDFDNAITAPLHGFRDVDDYYQRSSSKSFLKHIRVPTLILQSRDDPFLPVTALPAAHELGRQVTLELSEHGGHVGFVAGSSPSRPVFWLEQRITDHLDNISP